MTSFGRRGLTLIEIIVVIAIISVLLGLLLPAVQASRERVRETVCKNNLHQIDLAMGHYSQAMRHLPRAAAPGLVGGWMIDLLPYLEQTNLFNRIPPRTRVADAPEFLLRQPAIFRCPARSILEPAKVNKIDVAHYVFTGSGISDAPVDLKTPWVNAPEMSWAEITKSTGPHHGGFFYFGLGQQRVEFVSGGQSH